LLYYPNQKAGFRKNQKGGERGRRGERRDSHPSLVSTGGLQKFDLCYYTLSFSGARREKKGKVVKKVLTKGLRERKRAAPSFFSRFGRTTNKGGTKRKGGGGRDRNIYPLPFRVHCILYDPTGEKKPLWSRGQGEKGRGKLGELFYLFVRKGLSECGGDALGGGKEKEVRTAEPS